MNPRKGLIFAMEEADAPLVQVEINAEKEMSAEIEADSAALTEDAQEIDDLNTAVESAENDIDTLETINAEMVGSVEQGEGLDPTAARIAEVAIESICLRLMGSYDGTIVPSMESFGGKSSRLTATRIAIENNENFIIRGLKAIGAAIMSAFSRIVEFVQKFFDANERQKKEAAKMLEGLKNFKAEQPKEKEFENESLAKASIDGEGMSMDEVRAMVKNASLMVGYAETYAKELPGIFNQYEKDLKAAESEGSSSKGAYSGMEFQLSIIGKAKAAFPQVNEKSETDWTARSHYLVGGEFMLVTCKPKEDDTSGASGMSALTIEMKSVQRQAPVKTASVTLTPAEMATVLGEVIKLCNEASDLKNAIKQLENTKKRFNQMYNYVANVVAKKEDGFVANFFAKGKFRKEMSSTSVFTTALFKDVPKIVNRTGKACLFYVDQSIKQYPGMADSVKGYVGDKIDGAKKTASDTWDGAKDYAKSKASAADKAVAGAAYGAKDYASGKIDGAKNAVGGAVDGAKAYAGSKIDGAKNAASGAWGAASNKLKSAFAD